MIGDWSKAEENDNRQHSRDDQDHKACFSRDEGLPESRLQFFVTWAVIQLRFKLSWIEFSQIIGYGRTDRWMEGQALVVTVDSQTCWYHLSHFVASLTANRNFFVYLWWCGSCSFSTSWNCYRFHHFKLTIDSSVYGEVFHFASNVSHRTEILAKTL